MAVLADIERLLEQIFERSTARIFHTRIQVVQLERRVERTMDQGRVAATGRTTVPSRYRVRMHPSDLADTAARAGGADALAARLADAGLAFARLHGYHLPGRPTVALVADPSLPSGRFEVQAATEPAASPMSPTGGARPQAGDDAVRPGSAEVPPAIVGAPAAGIDRPAPSIRDDGSPTRVYRRPAPQAARAVLRIVPASGHDRTIEVDGTPLSIGRGPDNGLVLADGRVSRHHGRLQARRGGLVYTDLASTNGSRVNGVRVDEIALGQGDRLEIGDTVLVVETLPG